MQTILSLR